MSVNLFAVSLFSLCHFHRYEIYDFKVFQLYNWKKYMYIYLFIFPHRNHKLYIVINMFYSRVSHSCVHYSEANEFQTAELQWRLQSLIRIYKKMNWISNCIRLQKKEIFSAIGAMIFFFFLDCKSRPEEMPKNFKELEFRPSEQHFLEFSTMYQNCVIEHFYFHRSNRSDKFCIKDDLIFFATGATQNVALSIVQDI